MKHKYFVLSIHLYFINLSSHSTKNCDTMLDPVLCALTGKIEIKQECWKLCNI